jgi:hypothetical protein
MVMLINFRITLHKMKRKTLTKFLERTEKKKYIWSRERGEYEAEWHEASGSR